MAGLRERKRQRTITAIHEAAMRLFAERGYAAVTVTDIAEAAEVSRATVFAYYGTKEDIVLGDSAAAVASLETALEEAGADVPVTHVMRAWARTLVGWVEPDLLLQRRLAEEVPGVAAARARVMRQIEAVLAEAFTRELAGADPIAPRLAAGALASALVAVEAESAARMEQGAPPPDGDEVDALFGSVAAFIEGGLERLR